MMLLDAYAISAYLLGEPAADDVEAILRDRTHRPATTALSVGEVLDTLSRIAHVEPSDVLKRIHWLRDGGLEVLEVDALDGGIAGSLRWRFYDRDERPLTLSDCLMLGMALRHQKRIVTSDPALAATAREMKIEVVPLPDSQGRRPLGDPSDGEPE